MTYNEPQEVLAALAHAYYEERNTEAVLSCVTDDVEWIGTEKNDKANGKAELKKLLEADFAAFPNGFSVELSEPTVRRIGADLALITVEAKPQPAPGTKVVSVIRGTVCCVKTEQGWLISNGHTSVPNAEIERIFLQETLEEEREKQKALLDNIPGGVAMYRVKKDGRIPTDYVSDGLARICGYDDSADIMKVMGYDSRKLVLPEDYPIVAAACKASLEKGVPTSVQYRVHGKDGNPVRVTLDSVVMKNAPLGEDDVAVFYAVQTLVSEEAAEKAEEQKNILSLLNTVPAGIGIFEANADGFFQSYMNDAFYHLIGARREDRVQYNGKNVLTSTHPKDVAKVEEALKQLLGGKDSVQFDYRVMGGAGNWVWLHLVAAVVERNSGSVKLHVAYYECSESKQHQLQLLQNQRAVALAEQQGKIAIWTYNIDKGVIIQKANSTNVGHMGYPHKIANVPASFIEMNSIHPEDEEGFLNAYQRLTDGAEKVDVIYRLKDQNTGVYDWVHMYYQRIESNEDGDHMAVGFSVQVNEQQQAIERYQAEQKLRKQMYANATFYMECNLTNNRYEGKNTLTGHSYDGYLPNATIERCRVQMSAFVDERYIDEAVDKMYPGNLLRAFENGETRVSCEYRSKIQPGKPSAWYQITATMVKKPDSGDVMAFMYVEDIEETKNRQIAIENSMSDGIESIAIIRLADGQARLVQASTIFIPKEFRGYFVYDDNFVNRSHMTTVPEEREFSYHAALLSTVIEKLGKQDIYQYSISTKLADDAEKRQLFRFRYLDDRKTYVTLSVSDITEVYLEEQAKNKKLEAALAEANTANHAKTDFLSRVSHDMRTPLNGILGLTTLLKDTVTDRDVLQDLSELEMSGKYLLDLINDTLDMSRIESGNLELHPIVCDGRSMFNNIIRMGRISLKGRNITFDVQTEDITFTVLYVDVSRVEQIFMNVIGNAIKFTPDGGAISVAMSNVSVENGVITDKLVISDTGIGMSQEFLPHLFEAFTQEDATRTSTSQGTGLGMAITKQLVEQMGGSIFVESKLGTGSTFTIILKLQMANDEQIEEWKRTQAVSSGNVNLGGKRVLLCEDHPLNAKIATRLLEAKGMIVEHAENGKVGVEMFARSAPAYYDVILMDIRMPIMDGIEATKAIRLLERADAQSIPIIAMTANAFADDMEQTRNAGMNGHLSKPIQTDVLYATLGEEMQVLHFIQKQVILVVDDVEMNRAVIRVSLEKDYTILEAENGNQAMDIIRKTRVIDVVITDIQMPEMDGIELIRWIRSDKKYRHMVIIANTQFGDPEQEEQLLSLGANDFVYKPTTPTIVEIRVRNALKQI